MAKRICRTADRFDPTGMPRPRCCVRRATPPSCTAVVHEISQRDKDAFIFGEGCAGLARRQTSRDHSLPPGPGRAAPPICSDLIYDRQATSEAQSATKQAIRDWKQNLDRKASAELSSRGTLALQDAMETQVRSELDRLKECVAKIR